MAIEHLRHPETWPCDCCERNREDTTVFADGTRLCPDCELPLVRQQLAGAVSALRRIKDEEGKVCDQYQVCDHRECSSSYAAWVIADQYLRGVGRSTPTAPGDTERTVVNPLIYRLIEEIQRQDEKHGPYQGTILGRSRLALATLEDEVAEAKDAWRSERKAVTWDETRAEVLQVAAVAIRTLRDAL